MPDRMDAIVELLEAFGITAFEDLEVNDSYTVSVPGYDDLTVERVGEDRLSVAHYYTQRGDLMRDPEIVFRIDDWDDAWVPVEYQQDATASYSHDESGLVNIDTFVSQWNSNLRDQGFVSAAREQASS